MKGERSRQRTQATKSPGCSEDLVCSRDSQGLSVRPTKERDKAREIYNHT